MSRDIVAEGVCTKSGDSPAKRGASATSENTQGDSCDPLPLAPEVFNNGSFVAQSSVQITARTDGMHNDERPNTAAVPVPPEIPQIKKPNPFLAFAVNNYTYFLFTFNVAIGVWLGYGYYLLVKAAKDLPLEDWGIEWLLDIIAPIAMVFNGMMSIAFTKSIFYQLFSQQHKNTAKLTTDIIGVIVGLARIFAGYQLSRDSLKGLPCEDHSFQCTEGFEDTQVYSAVPYNFATSAKSMSDLLFLMCCAYKFFSLSKKIDWKPLAEFLKHKEIYTDKKRGVGKFIDLTQFPERTNENSRENGESLTEYQRFTKWFYQEADQIFGLNNTQGVSQTFTSDANREIQDPSLSVGRDRAQQVKDYVKDGCLYVGGAATSFSFFYFSSLAELGNRRFGDTWGLSNSNEWYGNIWNYGGEQALTILGGLGVCAMYLNGVRLAPRALSDFVKKFTNRYDEKTCGVHAGAHAARATFSTAAVSTGIGFAGAVYSMGGNYGSVANWIISSIPPLRWVFDYVLIDPVSWLFGGVLAGVVNGRSVLNSINECFDNEKYLKIYVNAYNIWFAALTFQNVDKLPDSLKENTVYIVAKQFKNEKDEIETKILYSLITPDGRELKDQMTELTVLADFNDNLAEKYQKEIKPILSAQFGATNSYTLLKGFLSDLFNAYKMPIDGGKKLHQESLPVWEKLEQDIRKLFENGQTEAELMAEIHKYTGEKTKYETEKDTLQATPNQRSYFHKRKIAKLEKQIAQCDAAIKRCEDMKKIFSEIDVESMRTDATLLTTAEDNKNKSSCCRWGSLFGARDEDRHSLLKPSNIQGSTASFPAS